MHFIPAFLAVSISTSESPIYRAFSFVHPISLSALNTESGAGFLRTSGLSPMAMEIYSEKYILFSSVTAAWFLFEFIASL